MHAEILCVTGTDLIIGEGHPPGGRATGDQGNAGVDLLQPVRVASLMLVGIHFHGGGHGKVRRLPELASEFGGIVVVIFHTYEFGR